MRYRIRQKGKYGDGTPKYVCDQLEGKVIATRTLPRPIYVWEWLCRDIKWENMSLKWSKQGKQQVEKYAQDLLTEPQESPKPRTLTEELNMKKQIDKLWEATK